MSLDTRGRQAAALTSRAAEGLGPAPELAAFRRRRTWRRGALALVAVAVAAAVVWQGALPARPAATRPGVPGFDPHVVAVIPIGRPSPPEDSTTSVVAAGPEGIWALDAPGHAVARIDPVHNTVADRVDVSLGPGWFPVAVWTGDGAVWVGSQRSGQGSALQRIDPAAAVTRIFPLPEVHDLVSSDLALAGGSAWLAAGDELWRIDQRSGRASRVEGVPAGPLAASQERLWVGGQLFDPRGGRVVGSAYGAGNVTTKDLAVAGGSLWATVEDPAAGCGVRRLTLSGQQLQSWIQLGQDGDTFPRAIAAGGRTVAAVASAALYLIDPRDNRLRATVALRTPGSVAVGAGAVWVSDADDGALLRVDPGA
jgi:hypothetical protein